MTDQNQVEHTKPEESTHGSPKFGRLLLVLLFAVALIVAITFATEAYYTS